jgi:hypothetical protein
MRRRQGTGGRAPCHPGCGAARLIRNAAEDDPDGCALTEDDTAGGAPAPPRLTRPHLTENAERARIDRLAREAAALRANLRRRKDQARAQAGPDAPPTPESDT